jgi:hypothetical protein
MAVGVQAIAMEGLPFPLSVPFGPWKVFFSSQFQYVGLFLLCYATILLILCSTAAIITKTWLVAIISSDHNNTNPLFLQQQQQQAE